jgi:hypothetical protein
MKAGSFAQAGDKSLCVRKGHGHGPIPALCRTLRRQRGPREWKSRRRPAAAPGGHVLLSEDVEDAEGASGGGLEGEP